MNHVLDVLKFFWALPWTLFGIAWGCLGILSGGRFQRTGRVFEFSGGWLSVLLARMPIVGGASAITFGQTVLAVSDEALDDTREHELVHIAQYERWGAFFIPAYLSSSLWMRVTRRSAYFDNVFEREAYGTATTRPGEGDVWMLLVAFATLIAFGCSAGILVGWFGRVRWYADLANHFQPHYFIGLIFAATILWMAGRFRCALVVLVVSCVPGSRVLALYGPQPIPISRSIQSRIERDHADLAAKGVETNLRIVSINVLTSNRDHDSVLRFIRRERPHAFVAIEVDEVWRAALDSLRDEYPYTCYETANHNFGIAAYSRVPETETALFHATSSHVPFTVMRIPIAGRSVHFVGVHVFPPMTFDRWSKRNADMQSIAAWIDANCGGNPVVIGGDFNCTTWSPFLTDFTERCDVRDSQLGFGRQGSWPLVFPIARWPMFRIPIDHVLVSRHFYVRDRRLGPDVGSDHLPVVVDLEF